MTPAQGVALFFNSLAEGLLLGLEDMRPRHVALKLDYSRIGTEDAEALARAILERFAGVSGLETTIDKLNQWNGSDACIIDCGGKRVTDIIGQITRLASKDAVVVVHNFGGDLTGFVSVEYDPDSSIDVTFPAIQQLFHECGKELDGLALTRFQNCGFQVFKADYELFDQPAKPDILDQDWTDRFCTRLSSVWRYAGAPVSATHIARWLGQFDAEGFGEEARYVLMYLHRYGYVTEQKIVAALRREYSSIAASAAVPPITVSFQAPGKSESKLAYYLRPEIALVEPNLAIARVAAEGAGATVDLICFDDCIGSGETVEGYLFYEPDAAQLIPLYKSAAIRLHVIAYHSDSRGVKRIEANAQAYGAVKVHTARPLDESHRAFSATSCVIPSSPRKDDFKSFCERIGRTLNPTSPLGWGDCQWCISYDYSIPDNSLPVLYGTTGPRSTWIGLFPRNR